MRRAGQFLLLVLLCFSTRLSAQEFVFTEKSLDVVLSEAKSQRKPVFAMLYASWCPHCHKMKADVLPDKEVQKALSSYLVYGFDSEKPEGRKLLKEYKLNSFPTFAFISPDGELLYAFSGELTLDKFIKEVSDAGVPTNQLPTQKAAFLADASNPDKALQYIQTLRKAGQYTNEAASAYFATIPDDKLVSAMNWKIFANGISRLDSRELQHVLAHQPEYAKVSSEKRVYRKIENIIMEALKQYADGSIPEMYARQQQLVSKIGHRTADSLLFTYDKLFYTNRKDWKGYQTATIGKVDKYALGNVQLLKASAETYLQHIEDKTALEKAIGWAREAEKLQVSKDAYLLTARLQEKAGLIADAKTSAQKAVDLCKQLGFDSKEATEVLTRLSAAK